ncbi:MAG: 4-hydroxythreonine-4-phosphate dehydrogenase PdxA [Acidobacteriota bacterium]
MASPADRNKPVISLMVGDPAGIGPEIVLKSLAEPEVQAMCRPLLVGNYDDIAASAKRWPPGVSLVKGEGKDTAEGKLPAATVEVVDVPSDGASFEVGNVSAGSGAIVHRSIRQVFSLLEDSRADGTVMAPIAKEALHRAGLKYLSEFEIYGELCHVDEVKAVVKSGDLYRSTVTEHIPFRDIPARLTSVRIENTARVLCDTMRQFGVTRPLLAVAALNPHAGEGGLMGNEEETIIAPAIHALAREGLDVQGPIPADTLFTRAKGGEFNGLIYLYHDQGNIAFKAASFGHLVLIYGGIPPVITSVGHGTAFDIAGKGVADHRNFVDAIAAAVQLVISKR